MALHDTNSIKFAHDTTIVGLGTNNDESVYWEVVSKPALWCSQFNCGSMAALITRQQKELATSIREMVCEEITSALVFQLKPIIESLAVLTANVDTYSKVESLEKATNVTEV